MHDKSPFAGGIGGFTKNAKNRLQLFHLKSDPKEKHEIASKQPDVVQRMATQHTACSKTLAPLGVIPKIRAREPIVPSGHGWAFAAAKEEGDGE